MNRTYQTRLIIIALAVAAVLVALTGLPGDANPSVGEAAITRAPRPHPTSNLASVNGAVLNPRPHPISHLSFPPGIDLLNPRPHPTSHIGLALNRA